MNKEKRTKIDQTLCDKVRVLLEHGLAPKKAAEMLGIGKATVYRIRDAGYDATRYNVNTDRRRIVENYRKADRAIEALQAQKAAVELVYDSSIAEEYRREQAEKELQGQIRMELAPAEEKKEEKPGSVMRFQAAMVDRVISEMDKINDTLNQLIRVMRHE